MNTRDARAVETRRGVDEGRNWAQRWARIAHTATTTSSAPSGSDSASPDSQRRGALRYLLVLNETATGCPTQNAEAFPRLTAAQITASPARQGRTVAAGEGLAKRARPSRTFSCRVWDRPILVRPAAMGAGSAQFAKGCSRVSDRSLDGGASSLASGEYPVRSDRGRPATRCETSGRPPSERHFPARLTGGSLQLIDQGVGQMYWCRIE